MNGGGPGSGIWKSTDGGETWTRLKTGLPEGSLGRIAIDVYRKRSNILYSEIEGPAAGRGTPGAGATVATGGTGNARVARGAGGAAAPAGNPDEAPAAPQGLGGGRGPAVGADRTTPTGLYRSDAR